MRLIGDLPIYVAPDGADQRFHPELFRPGVVAGAPPDSLSATGQLWGNPLYDWPALRRRGYRWWIERLRRSFELVDLVRVDHFRGFVSFWAVPEGAATRRGRPLAARARARRSSAPRGPSSAPLPLIVEDLGVITPAGRAAARRARPARDGRAAVRLRRRAATTRTGPRTSASALVVYTGTHDMDTALGWWRGLTRRAAAPRPGSTRPSPTGR